MHTSETLRGIDFAIVVAGRPAALQDVLPQLDRLGIVISSEHGAAGASMLILAAVTAFYDGLRTTGEPFFAYADYFAFNVGRSHGSLRKLDVYPEHKEVVVTGGIEALLQAINDRAVTHLLIPDTPAAADPEAAPETLHSARRRITHALAYDPSGRTADADVTVSGPPAARQFAAAMTQQAPRAAVESYRRTTPAQALRMLQTAAG